MGCKVTGHQTFRMIGPRPGIEPGHTGWLGSGPAGRPFLRPPTLTASNFAALWPTDPKFSAFKHLNLLKKHTKNQEASSILRVVFALSKWPHLHREWGLSWIWYEQHCTVNQLTLPGRRLLSFCDSSKRRLISFESALPSKTLTNDLVAGRNISLSSSVMRLTSERGKAPRIYKRILIFHPII